MKKKILFVSVSFPPKADPEGLQTAKYFHYLQKHQDTQIDVVTSGIPTLNMPYDPDLEPYASGINQLISIPLKENRYKNFLLNKLGLQQLIFPDIKSSFHTQFKKAVKDLKQKPDLIYSRACPNSSTIMAYKLKSVLNVPWILHMSDPWADCPIKRMSGRNYERHNEWERKCFEAADIISLTSLLTLKFYKEKYAYIKGKFRFYPNVYENLSNDQVNKPEEESADHKFKIVYTGGLAEERSPEFLLRPLEELFKEDPAIAAKLEVIFAGDVDSRNRAVFQQFKLPFVKWIGKISFNAALQLQRSADYLVVIDSPIDDPAMSMFFPSKLLDYMVARKRILAITTKGSASYQVMQDLKGDVCTHGESEAIKSSIVKTLKAFDEGDRDYLLNNEPPKKYEASYNADRLYNEIITLLND